MQSPTNNEAPEPHNELSDIEFTRQFENLLLNPEWFTHEAHLRLAWVYSYIYDFEKAVKKYRAGIQNFDFKYGDGTKYHETITVFLLKLVYQREAKKTSITFEQFKTRNPELFKGCKTIIKEHYSFDVMKDTQAKENFVAPDLRQLN